MFKRYILLIITVFITALINISCDSTIQEDSGQTGYRLFRVSLFIPNEWADNPDNSPGINAEYYTAEFNPDGIIEQKKKFNSLDQLQNYITYSESGDTKTTAEFGSSGNLIWQSVKNYSGGNIISDYSVNYSSGNKLETLKKFQYEENVLKREDYYIYQGNDPCLNSYNIYAYEQGGNYRKSCYIQDTDGSDSFHLSEYINFKLDAHGNTIEISYFNADNNIQKIYNYSYIYNSTGTVTEKKEFYDNELKSIIAFNSQGKIEKKTVYYQSCFSDQNGATVCITRNNYYSYNYNERGELSTVTYYDNWNARKSWAEFSWEPGTAQYGMFIIGPDLHQRLYNISY